jgi:hypothetical protein
MLGHGHFQRGKLADPGIGDPRRQRPVDHPLRQMPDKIDDAGMSTLMPRRHELVEHAFNARPDAFEATRRGEEGSYERRPHESLTVLVIARLDQAIL